MSQILLITEVDTLKTYPGGRATANIWLEINGRDFPMRQWNDFVIVVMSWWAAAMLRLVRGSIAETVDFMDGPFTVEITKTPAGLLRFRALEGSNRSNEMAIGEGTSNSFISRLISESQEVLSSCRRRAWWSKDAEILESSIEALERETAGGLSNA